MREGKEHSQDKEKGKKKKTERGDKNKEKGRKNKRNL